jgi:hypothetical protein
VISSGVDRTWSVVFLAGLLWRSWLKLTGANFLAGGLNTTEDHVLSTPARTPTEDHLLSTPAKITTSDHLLSTQAMTFGCLGCS